MEKPKAVIYIRVSDESQIKNNSLETQLKSCYAFAEANGLEVVEVFRDEGVSAKHVQTRPEMRRLLQFCTLRKNNIARVIVYKMDRWTRNVEEGLIAMSLLAKYGVAVIPATEVADQTPMGKAMRTILMALGELDNGLKSERVKDNMQTMFRNGLWCWKLPIGYMRPKGEKKDIKGKSPILDTRLSEMITLLFEKASESKYSKKYLSVYLNSIGFKQAYGKEANGKLITSILSNTFYYGYMYAQEWNEYSWGKHQPIVSQEVWENANVNTFGRKRKYTLQDSLTFPLKGILRCGSCNHPQTSSNPKGRAKNYLYYECHNKQCTTQERIGVEEASNQFLQILSSLKPSKRVLKLFSTIVFEEWDTSIEKSRNEARLIEEQVVRLENKLTGIAESNSKGILTDEEAKDRAEEIRQEIAVLKIERSDYKIEEYDTEAVKNFTESFLTNLDRFWLQLGLPDRQLLQEHIFPEGLACKDKTIRTTKLAGTFNLISALEDPNFNLVSSDGFEPSTFSLRGNCSTAEL